MAIVGCNDDQAASFVTPGLSTVKLHNEPGRNDGSKDIDGMSLYEKRTRFKNYCNQIS